MGGRALLLGLAVTISAVAGACSDSKAEQGDDVGVPLPVLDVTLPADIAPAEKNALVKRVQDDRDVEGYTVYGDEPRVRVRLNDIDDDPGKVALRIEKYGRTTSVKHVPYKSLTVTFDVKADDRARLRDQIAAVKGVARVEDLVGVLRVHLVEENQALNKTLPTLAKIEGVRDLSPDPLDN